MYAGLDVIKGGAESIVSQQQVNLPMDTLGKWKSGYNSPTRSQIFRKPVQQEIRIQFNVSPVKSKKKKYQEEFANFFIEQILHNLENVKNNFDDLRDRQIFFYQFKRDIENLWDFVPQEDFSENLVMLLVDIIENLKAENIARNQIDSIKEVIEAISRGNITENKLDFYIKFLMENDIPLVRLPENISHFYD